MRTEGHPNCLRIAAIFFVLAFGLSMMAFGQEAAREGQGPARGSRSGMASVPNVADSGHSKFFTAVTAGYLALSAEDFYLSNRCIQSGACVEVGSYRGVASHPLAFALVKMGASSALAATAWSLRKSHKKAAWGVLVGLTVAQSAVVVWNSQQGRVR